MSSKKAYGWKLTAAHSRITQEKDIPPETEGFLDRRARRKNRRENKKAGIELFKS